MSLLMHKIPFMKLKSIDFMKTKMSGQNFGVCC